MCGSVAQRGDHVLRLGQGALVGQEQLGHGPVLEPDALMPRATAIAEMIAANAPLAVEGVKAIARVWRYRGVDESRRLPPAVCP